MCYTNTYTYLCKCMCMHLYMCIYIYIYTNICVLIYICVYMCVCIYIYIYITGPTSWERGTMREATRSDARHMGVRGCASVTQAMRQTPRTMATTLASFLSRIRLFRLLVVAVSQYFFGFGLGTQHTHQSAWERPAAGRRPRRASRHPWSTRST